MHSSLIQIVPESWSFCWERFIITLLHRRPEAPTRLARALHD